MAKPKQKKYDAINQMLDGDIIFEDTREPSAAVKLITLISKIIVVVVISGLFCFYVVLFFTGGCKLVEELEIHEDGYFQYIILGESGPYSDNDVTDAVAIIGFSALGRQQEVIDFPKEIDGKPVCYIGYRDWNTFTESFFHLESDNLKKVYIHENIKSVYPEAFYYFRENEYDLDVMICAIERPYSIFFERYFVKFYIYKSLYESTRFNSNVYNANIVFMNNYSAEINGGYYSLDNIIAGEKIPLPPDPEREGYIFDGWYIEPECINKWDFETSPVIEEDAEFRLYAGWRSI